MYSNHSAKNIVRLLVAIIAILICSSACIHASTGVPQPRIGVFQPVAHPSEPGAVDLLFRFAPPDYYKGDGAFTVRAVAREAGQYAGVREWTFTATIDSPHEEIVTFTVVPDTISGLSLYVAGQGFLWSTDAYFIHRNDSIEFWQGYPQPPEVPADQTQKPDDTLDIRFTLNDTTQLRKVLEITGDLPDSSLGVPIVTRTTWRQLFEIINQGVSAKNLDINRTDDPSKAGKGYWIIEPKQPQSDTGTKSTPGNSDNGDRISPQGSLNSERDDRYPAVCIDTVIPMVDGGTVLASDAVHHASAAQPFRWV